MKTWFDIKAKAEAKDGEHDAEVFIFDEIGAWGIRAKDFVSSLKATKTKRPLVRINSPGGDVFDGLAIFNFLRSLEATVQIDGLAASIASVIALAGKEVRIADNGFLMIHNPWGFVAGDADAMREYAEMLSKLEDTLANAYAKKSGKTAKEAKKWMADETWFTAAEAKAAGLVDTVTDEVSFSASLRSFKSAPAALTQQQNQNTKMKKLTEALASAGLIASADLDDNAAAEQFTANLKALTDERDALKAKLKTNEDAAAAQAKANAVALVDAAVADGRIVAEHREIWVGKLSADADASKLLESIAKPRPAGTPMASHLGNGNGAGKPKTLTEQCIEARQAAEAGR
jgi:ATP-dependent protease ClpP protease subunit